MTVARGDNSIPRAFLIFNLHWGASHAKPPVRNKFFMVEILFSNVRGALYERKYYFQIALEYRIFRRHRRYLPSGVVGSGCTSGTMPEGAWSPVFPAMCRTEHSRLCDREVCNHLGGGRAVGRCPFTGVVGDGATRIAAPATGRSTSVARYAGRCARPGAAPDTFRDIRSAAFCPAWPQSWTYPSRRQGEQARADFFSSLAEQHSSVARGASLHRGASEQRIRHQSGG